MKLTFQSLACIASILYILLPFISNAQPGTGITNSVQSCGKWTPTGSMETARWSHTATLLNNGKVLVAGGRVDEENVTTTADLYDPATNSWTSTGSMNVPRLSHTATLLADGRVLVAGGQNSSATSSAEIYDPATGVWTPIGNMNTPRTAHIAILITTGALSGMVLVAGGSDVCRGCEPIATAELYNPKTGQWVSTGSMNLGRYWDNPSPVTLPGGSIMVVGGVTCCPYDWINEAEIYNPATQTWTTTGDKKTKANETTVLLPGGQVLVAGGANGIQSSTTNVADAELFNSATGTWIATAKMSTDRSGNTLTLLANGQALVTGGLSGGWGVCNNLTSAELYDPVQGVWLRTGDMSVSRIYHTATILSNGQVLVTGGRDCDYNVYSSAELYTPPCIDHRPQLSIEDDTVSESQKFAFVKVHLSKPGNKLIEVGYTTMNNSAVHPKDYIGVSRTLFFKPGSKLTRTIAIPIINDTAQENTEAFFVYLKDPINAGIADKKAVVTILDDDGPAVKSSNEVELTGRKNTALYMEVYPNPSKQSFNIKMHSSDNADRVFIHVYDMNGKLIEERNNVSIMTSIQLGDRYKAGTYVVQAEQGSQRARIKIIKQDN
jgi:hypothetical protein